MEFSRSEYPAMLASLQPGQAVEVLNERIKHVGKLNAEIADWLQERRRVEEAYAVSMRKLAQKRPPDGSSEMGIFTEPWQKLVNSAETLAESHHLLAAKIEADVERPLRDFVSRNRELQAMSTISGNLGAMAKEIESSQKKAEKLQSKGGKAQTEKMAGATTELETANAQWESQAPYVFEKLQAVDESRLNALRDLLTQLQTHEVDQIERNRKTAEECLNTLLTLDTADEIKLFQLRATQGKSRTAATDRRERRMTLPGTSSAATNDMAPPPLPTPRAQDDQALGRTLSPPAATQDGASERSGSVEQERKRSLGFGGGLKRLGTVIGRTPKKEKSKEKGALYGRPEPPERKSSSNLASAFSSLGGRGKSRGRDSVMPPPVEVDEGRPAAASPAEESSAPPVLTLSFNGNDANGDSSSRGLGDVVSPGTRVNGTQVPSFNQEPLQPTGTQKALPAEPPRDSEGFSVAPAATDAITQAEQDAAAVGGMPLSGAEPALKFDIRNAPIQEEDTAGSKEAFDNMANTLRAAPPPSRKTGTLRGRRDVRNTIFVPSPVETQAATGSLDAGVVAAPAAAAAAAPVSPPSATQASPFRAPTRVLSDDTIASDTQSVRSGRSLASTASVIKHPDFHQQGLNSSIVESVSANFENGTITKAMMIGEVALAYNPADVSSAAPFGTERIRLDNFNVLNKVAPNPALFQEVQNKNGLYTVNLSAITRTTVAFKYQVHHDEHTSLAHHVPLSLTLQWKIEDAQTSAIVNYALSPNFALPPGQSSVTISNVAVILHLDPSGAKANNAKAANGGTFMRERSAVYWRLGDITLSKDAPAQQLRARFFTDGEAKPGNAEARWEITSENAAGLGSGLDVSVLEAGGKLESDPFADDDAAPADKEESWTRVHGVKALRSGTNYTAS